MNQQRAQDGQILRYFIARNTKLGAIIKIFITHLSRFGAIIKFWDKIYTTVLKFATLNFPVCYNCYFNTNLTYLRLVRQCAAVRMTFSIKIIVDFDTNFKSLSIPLMIVPVQRGS